jgi:hypothetical protein
LANFINEDLNLNKSVVADSLSSQGAASPKNNPSRPGPRKDSDSSVNLGDIYGKIDTLRQKLLDLSRNNPLISARLSSRSNSVVRAIDELPESLLWTLVNGRSLRFKALPPLEKESDDENSKDFLSALAAARLTRLNFYQNGLSSDKNDSSAVEVELELDLQSERALRDEVRKSQGLKPRPKGGEVSFIELAKKHNINPDYDLPPQKSPTKIPALNKDRDIQTLLPPPDLERKLTSLFNKCRQAEEETGVNVLKAVFGFLEWVDDQGATLMSPLILLSLRLTRKPSPRGLEFSVKAEDDEAEVNIVLAKKLKKDLGLELPDLTLDNNGFPLLEDYFLKVNQLATIKSIDKTFQVRRQVAFGLFPSSRLAMYEDLGPNRHDYQNLPLIQDFIFGSNSSAPGLFADDYEIDRPEIEAKIPGLVLDADSSQASILVDLKDGRNLAVEGPPGTGKSQTIVNAIAAALADGKSVLFVAEKQAALEVVRSRLEAVGLGEYLLPLQAQRSTKSQALAAIKARVVLGLPPSDPDEYQKAVNKYQRLRNQLNAYATLVSTRYGSTGLSTYEVIARYLRWAKVLKNARDFYKNPPDIDLYKSLSQAEVLEVASVGRDLEKALKAAASQPAWRGTNLYYPDPLVIERVLNLAQETGSQFAEVAAAKSELGPELENRPEPELYEILKAWVTARDKAEKVLGLARLAINHLAEAGRLKWGLTYGLANLSLPKLWATKEFVGQIGAKGLSAKPKFLAELAAAGLFEAAKYYYQMASQYDESRQTLAAALVDPEAEENAAILAELKKVSEANDLDNFNPDQLAKDLAQSEKELEIVRLLDARLGVLVPSAPELGRAPFTILKAIKDLFEKTPSIVYQFKSSNTFSVNYLALKAHNETGEALLVRRAELATKLDPDCYLSPQELRTMAEVFLMAGFFKFLSPSFHRNKKLYLTIATNPLRPLKEAAQDLRDLADYKEKVLAFAEDPKVKTAYGDNFNGLKTDFAFFGQVASFWAELEVACPTASYPEIRQSLKNGEPRLLSTILTSDFPDTWEDFYRQRDRLEKSEAFQKTLRTVLSQLKNLAPALKPTADWRRASISRLSSLLTVKREFEAFLGSVPLLTQLVPPVDQANLGSQELAELAYFAARPQYWPLLAQSLALGADELTKLGSRLDQLFDHLATSHKAINDLFSVSALDFLADLASLATKKPVNRNFTTLLWPLAFQPLAIKTTARAGYGPDLGYLDEVIGRLAMAGHELASLRESKTQELDDFPKLLGFFAETINLPDPAKFIEAAGLDKVIEVINLFFEKLTKAQKTLDGLNAAANLNLHFSGAESLTAAETLGAMAQDRTGFLAHVEVESQKRRLRGQGFASVVFELENNGLPKGDLGDLLTAMISRGAVIGVTRDYGLELSNFHGIELDRLRAELSATDKTVINLYRRELRRKAFVELKNLPRGVVQGPVSSLTEMGLITHELKKKIRHAPIRELTKRAGAALIALKPCWMMSPLAVSTYLPAGGLTFDLGVIDEASQMTPENALGALVRCQKIMVVGDANQLPPTNFFKTLIKQDDDDEAGDERGVTDESILDLANKIYLPGRRLRWHYRSRHPSLIQFSNGRIYNNELMVFPAPNHLAMGVSLVKTHGLYQSGVNPIEADYMVKAAVLAMKAHPERSLGLVTLNQKQMELVQLKMEIERSQDPKVADYISRWEKRDDGLSTFFVKNLESVQGDERDFIYIGTVYGPGVVNGPVANRFGPINGESGQRRLNVLITRAKRRIVTFTSMEPSDIKGDFGGPAMLRDWLIYSDQNIKNAGQSQSESLASDGLVYLASDALAAFSFQTATDFRATTQEGLDLAVRNPSFKEEFVLGLTTDGPRWHGRKSARDRDRLIDEVLTGLGWKLYRLWSTKWLLDPDGEAQKLKMAVMANLEATARQKKTKLEKKKVETETETETEEWRLF